MTSHSQRFALPAFPLRTLAFAAAAFCSTQAFAVQPFTVRDIRVEGLQRIEAGTVFSYLPVRVGDTYNDEKGIAAIKALFGTGFFKDVRLDVEGNVLVVEVEERPAIASVTYTGVKEFEKDQLDKALKDIGLDVAHIYDKALVVKAEQELKHQYLARGRYGVEITTTVTPVERNRVEITFAVDEGDTAKIRKITFVGNKEFSDRELMKSIKLRTPGWFTWYNKVDQYSKEKLTGDIESLKSFYLNRGYIEMQVDSTEVSVSPDRKGIYITINIKEGKKYTVSDVKLEGELFGREEELKKLIQLKPGEIYSAEKLADSTKKISDLLGTFGYAFANVNANPDIDHEHNRVAFTILVDPGKRVYIHKISIGGNTRTRDEVIRREFRQFENSWYDGDKIKRSKERVERLDYFKDVNIETPEVPNTNDQVDIDMTVTEKPTGTLTLGVGYSQAEGVILSGGWSEENVFGSGNNLGVSVNTSKLSRSISVTQFNPYFTDDGVSRSIDIYTNTARPPLLTTDSYKVQTLGTSIQFGAPVSEFDHVSAGFGLEQTDVQTFLSRAVDANGVPLSDPYGLPVMLNQSPLLYQRYVSQFGGPNATDAKTLSLPLSTGWLHDSRDSALTPSKGDFHRAVLEVVPAQELHYYRFTYQEQHYRPLTNWITLALNGEFDYGHGFGGKPYPVFKNYYAGGIGSVRGFEASSLGPMDLQTQTPLGGTSRIIGNAELQFAPSGSGKDNAFRGFLFFDMGNVFADKIHWSGQEGLRYSAGIGFSWISPVGPMKISLGKPLNQKPGDRREGFQFQVGTGF